MKNQLEWHKSPTLTNRVRQKRVSHQTNSAGRPLFIIEKAAIGHEANRYRLFQQTDPIMYLHQTVGVFKKISTAKKVAELIYKDSCYGKPSRKSKK